MYNRSKINDSVSRSSLVGRRVQRDRWGEPVEPFARPKRSDPAPGPVGLMRILAGLIAQVAHCHGRCLFGPHKN